MFSQANISQSGPLVQVVPHRNLGVIIDSRKPTFNSSNLLSRPAREYLRIYEIVWKYLKASEITWKKKRDYPAVLVLTSLLLYCWIQLDEPHTVDKSLLAHYFVRSNMGISVEQHRSKISSHDNFLKKRRFVAFQGSFLEYNPNDVLHESRESFIYQHWNKFLDNTKCGMK